MKRGLVHDAASAKIVAEVNELLRSVDMALCDHVGVARQGIYGELWSGGLEYDLTALRARLDRVRELINGST